MGSFYQFLQRSFVSYPKRRPFCRSSAPISSRQTMRTEWRLHILTHRTAYSTPCWHSQPNLLPHLTHLLLHLQKQVAYSVRLFSSSEMESKIRSRASNLAVSQDFRNSRLRRIWIQDGDCCPGASKLEIFIKKQILDGVEVCIARPLVPAFGREVGLVVLSSSGEITSVLRNYGL